MALWAQCQYQWFLVISRWLCVCANRQDTYWTIRLQQARTHTHDRACHSTASTTSVSYTGCFCKTCALWMRLWCCETASSDRVGVGAWRHSRRSWWRPGVAAPPAAASSDAGNSRPWVHANWTATHIIITHQQAAGCSVCTCYIFFYSKLHVHVHVYNRYNFSLTNCAAAWNACVDIAAVPVTTFQSHR